MAVFILSERDVVWTPRGKYAEKMTSKKRYDAYLFYINHVLRFET